MEAQHQQFLTLAWHYTKVSVQFHDPATLPSLSKAEGAMSPPASILNL
jgi:hypothetical protein